MPTRADLPRHQVGLPCQPPRQSSSSHHGSFTATIAFKSDIERDCLRKFWMRYLQLPPFSLQNYSMFTLAMIQNNVKLYELEQFFSYYLQNHM